MSTISPELAVGADVLVRDFMAVKRDETVLITVDTATDPLAGPAVMNAVAVAGARPTLVTVPQLPFQGALADPFVGPVLAAAAVSADVWIDLTFPYLAGCHPWDVAMKQKRARYMLCGDLTADAMVRMFAKVDLDRLFKVHNGFTAITADSVGKSARITNELGSDVTFTLDKAPYPKPRRAVDPGLYTVPGAMAFWPVNDSVKGRIVVDAAFHEYYTKLASPITFEIDGHIRGISGGGADRKVMDRALKRAAGGEYGYVIHFTCGISPAARYTGGCFVEDQRVTGNNAIGLGIPFWKPGGGENHPDAVLSLQSIWIDGKKIVENGTIVGPAKLAKAAETLQPLYA